MEFLALAVLLTLGFAWAGRWSSLTLPVGSVLLGLYLYAAAGSTPFWGVDGDPKRIAGKVILLFGLAWTVLVAAMLAVARAYRAERRAAQQQAVPMEERQ
jgi:carbohydrate-selective porin OprB